MWHGTTLYFLSDRDAAKRANIWALDVATGATRQVTRFADFDVRFPAIGPSDIVFEAGGRLYLLDLAEREGPRGRGRGRHRPRDAASRATENVAKLIAERRPSRRPASAPLFEARGDVFTVPAEHGVVART